jgi:hypothetical protein
MFVFQADVCHAYQLLVDQGVKPENIVVFMYDDIAFHKEVKLLQIYFHFDPTLKVVIYTSKTCSKNLSEEPNKIFLFMLFLY